MKAPIPKILLVLLFIIMIFPFSVSADYLYDSVKERIDSTLLGLDECLRRKMQDQDKLIKLAQGNFRSSTLDTHPLPKKYFLNPAKKEMDENERRGFSVEFDISQLRGHTTYEIGGMTDDPNIGNLHFPISKLEFPLKSYLASLKTNIDITNRLNLILSLKMNVTSDAGKFKDSDWGYYWYIEKNKLNMVDPWAEQNTLDIYSECDADLDLLIVDFNLRYHIYKNMNFLFFTGIGYKNQGFDYEISNVNQWYPSFEYYDNLPDTPEFFDDPNIIDFNLSGHDYYKGEAILYNISYNIPYIEIGTGFGFNRFSCEARCAYSPIVNVRDEDYHKLRAKKSYGNCDGYALMLSFNGYINFMNGWFLSLGYSYTEISTEGTQTQHDYFSDRIEKTKIDQEIKSLQRLYSLSLGYLW